MNTRPFAAPMQRAERIRVIGQRAGMPSRGHPVLLKGRYHEFPVAAVPHGALAYRVDNGRLIAELEEWSAKTGSSLEGLRRQAETAEAQALLHNLLIAKARDPDGPIFAELERLGQQTEPLLVTFDGVVINGNRRLAAMRELLARDAGRYAFAEPIAAVLPEAIEPRDIEYIEASLQMAPETKLRYGWLDRRLKLRKQRDVLKLQLEEIRAAYRIDDAAEIDRELAELALAEDYLKAYRGEPARYSAVADAEELFVGLRAQLAQLGEADRLFWRIAGFAMIDGRSEAPARARPCGGPGASDKMSHPFARLFPFAPPEPPLLPSLAQRRLASRFGVTPSDDAPLRAEAIADLLAIFRDRSRSRQTARQMADVLDELRLEHNERNAPQRMLQKVREAGQLIARLEPERLSPEQRRQLRGDLAALRSHAAYLMGEMEEKPTLPARWRYPKAILRPPYGKVPRRLMRRLGWIAPKRAP